MGRLQLLWVLLVFGLLGALGDAKAQQPSVNLFLQEWDSDHDGTLSLDETREAAAAQFDKLDQKKKGKLTRNQLSGIVAYQQFRQADKDHDGTLDKSEFVELSVSLFKDADKDDDGTLDKKELGSAPGKALIRLFAPRKRPLM